MLFFTVLNYLSSFERIKILLNAFIYSGTALSVYLLLNSNLGSRIGWIVGNVNRIGNLLSFALIFAGYYLFVEKKFIYIPHFIIIGISVLLSGARQSLLFCASTFFILLILRYRRGLKNKLKLIVILIVVAALGYFLLFQVPIVYKVLGSRIEILNNFIVDRKAGGSSINTRMRMIRFGLKAFKKRPLMGFGIDHYKFLYGRFFRTVYAHNNYIELLVDTGIIGFVLFYGAFVNVLRLSIQGIKSNHRFSELGLAFVIGLLVLGNFSVYYAYKTIFVIFALFIAHHRLSVKEDTSKQVETLLENESL
jgi:O-antigen ligase